MAKKSEKEVLEVGVSVEKALQDMTKMERATKRNFSEVAKAVDKLNLVNKKATKGAKKGNMEWQASLEDLTRSYKDEAKEIENVMDTIDLLTKKAAKQSDAEQKATLADIELLKKKGRLAHQKMTGKERVQGRAVADKAFKEGAKEWGDSLKETLSAVFVSKDLKSALESSAKFLVKGLKTTTGAGLKARNFGKDLSEKGKERGGVGGMAMQGGGKAMQTIGKMMGGFKPLVEMLTEIGPILGAIGGGVMALGKLFLDMDANVKGFNKDILASASNTEFLSNAGGDASDAFEQMNTTLKGTRDAANSFDNINWGISEDQYKGMLNTLNQEGVALADIGQQAGKSAGEVQAFTEDLAHVSVAYSRAFGVPLQEINTMQATMVQEMGVGLASTAKAFQQINAASVDAGVGANKFFGMIRGVSQDLSLWNNRMEAAAVLLGKLMKNMSPQTAQKFFNTLQQGFKGKGRMEMLQGHIMGGKEDPKILKADMALNVRHLAKDIIGAQTKTGKDGQPAVDEDAVDALADKITKQGRSAVDLSDPTLKEMRGSISESFTKFEMTKTRASKGAYGMGEAMTSASPAAAAEAKINYMMFLAGTKDLKKAAGDLAAGVGADMQGASVEDVTQLAMLQDLVKDQKEFLKNNLQDPDVQKKLQQAGIGATADAIDKTTFAQTVDTMEQSQKDLVSGVSAEESLAKSQAKAQTSFYDQFGMLVKFLMNTLYDAIMGIWDSINSLPGMGGAKAKTDLGSKDLRQVVDAADPAKAMLESPSWKGLMGGLEKAKGDPKQADKFKKATDSIVGGFDPDQIAKAAEQAGVGKDKIDQFNSTMGSGARLDAFTPDDMMNIVRKITVWQGDSLKMAQSVKAGMKALGAPDAPAAPAAAGAADSPYATAPDAPAATGYYGAAGATPSTPAAAPPAPPEVREQVSTAQDTLDLTGDQHKTMQSIDKKMDKFKMDTTFLNGKYSKAVEGSVLKSVRTALFEYYMYKDMKQSDVMTAMQNGGLDPSTFGAALTDTGKTGDAALASIKPAAAPAHANGGVVTGVNNGMAQVTAAAGEGLASIGKGESIVPSGGGGGTGPISVTVNGVGGNDLARIIQAKVVDGIHEYKRKERFH